MDFDDRCAAIDMLFCRQSGERRCVHVTFFGGETLMNFPLLERVVEYANLQRPALRQVDRFQPHHQRHAAYSGDHSSSSPS